MAPGLRADDVECAAWEPNGGYGDGAIVAGDLLAAARARGGAVPAEHAGRRAAHRRRPGHRRADRRRRSRVRGHRRARGRGLVAAAARPRPWIDLPIETELHRVAVLAHGTGAGAPVACIDSTTQTYFRPEAGGPMTLVGAFTGPARRRPGRVPASAAAG